MTLAQGIFVFVVILAVGNSLLVGIYLMIRSKRSKPTFFLGIYLLLGAVVISPAFFKALYIWDQMHILKALPILSTVWLLFPTFYFYTQSVSAFSKKRKPYWMFVPGFFFVALVAVANFFPETYFGGWNRKLDITVFRMGHFYSFFIIYLNLKHLNSHSIQVGDYFSSVRGKELKWIRTFLYVHFGVMLFSFVMTTLVDQHNYWLRLPYGLTLFFALFWISFHGTKQLNIARIMENPGDYGLSQKIESPKKKQKDVSKELGGIMVKLQELFHEKELYTNSELNIMDVAVAVGIHPKKLSRAINEFTGENFNFYVNRLRVEKAKELLKDPAWQNITLDGVGKEVGFQSKSTFYRAFKILAGSTPLEYYKSLELAKK